MENKPSPNEEAIRLHHATGGSTFNARGENLAGRHLWATNAVPEGTLTLDRAPTPDEHAQFAQMHAGLLQHPNAAVGTHHDTRTGLHHVELVGVTPNKHAALDLAQSLGEDNVHGLANHEKLHTGVTGRPDFISHSPAERLDLLHQASPKKQPYSGTHYSNSSMDTIEGSRRGMPDPKTGQAAGGEAWRLRLGSNSQGKIGPDAPAGFYTHDAGSLPDHAMVARKFAHPVSGHLAIGSTDSPEFTNAHKETMTRALLAGADPKTAHGLGINAGEHALKDHGYDGYRSPNQPGTTFLYGNHIIDRGDNGPSAKSGTVK